MASVEMNGMTLLMLDEAVEHFGLRQGQTITPLEHIEI
jgi:hypothetical protein